MSTIEVKMFSLTCDGCGVDSNEGTDFAAYTQEFASREIAHEEGWLTTDDGRDWCPECVEWDEDGNGQRPKASLPAPTGPQEAVSPSGCPRGHKRRSMAKKQKLASKLTFQEALDQLKVATGKSPEDVAEMVESFRKAGEGMAAEVRYAKEAWQAFVEAFNTAPKEEGEEISTRRKGASGIVHESRALCRLADATLAVTEETLSAVAAAQGIG